MKICVPTDTDEGLSAAVAERIGRARFFTLVDMNTKSVVVLPHVGHLGRRCTPSAPLQGTGVDAVVCGAAGQREVASLRATGIRVMITDAPRVEDAVTAVSEGGLRALAPKDACGGRARTAQSECPGTGNGVRRRYHGGRN